MTIPTVVPPVVVPLVGVRELRARAEIAGKKAHLLVDKILAEIDAVLAT